ncbi:hypothetical protein GCM10023201_28140 [Actinomycetospora corticicola]|uniref:Uncharacterized protein n=1 Tax=Actinomycetospora corticicola TaxID=663602 RepID=A0A7Y9DWX5_9PSEU|nr:hypothetical protein [Actinomycetospora corticicola]NYD37053.1 hypothetical protein [Actinomycetospora corticicola]
MSTTYELHGIVGAPDVLEPLREQFPHARPSLLDGAELALVPLCEQLFHDIDLPDFTNGPDWAFDRLSSGVAAMLTAASRVGPVAYLEADYAGGLGRQSAVAWLDCHVVYGPDVLLPDEPFPVSTADPHSGSPIVKALRYLGVQAVGSADEFVLLGLGRYRSTRDWCDAWTPF